MAALDGSETLEVTQNGQRIIISTRDLAKKLFRVTADSATQHKLRIADTGSRIRMTSGSACTVLVPNDSDSLFEDFAAFEIEQAGAGQVTIVPSAGVTIDTAETLLTAKQYAVLYLVRIGANHWHCCGYQQAAA